MPAIGTLEESVVATVAYFDVFACAPMPREVHRFLLAHRASRREVEDAIRTSPYLAEVLGRRDGFVYLAGKEHLAVKRHQALAHTAVLWPKARRIARIIGASGLARAGIVSGALALDNTDEESEVELVFIFPGDRPFASLAAVRLSAKILGYQVGALSEGGALSESALAARPEDLFTAFEIARAVPVFGFEVFRAFVHANRWVARYLPNALPDLEAPPPAPGSEVRRLGLGAALTQPIRALEAVERRRSLSDARRGAPASPAARPRRAAARSFQALSELRYRMRQLALDHHPLFADLTATTHALASGGVPASSETSARVPDEVRAEPAPSA